MTRVLTETEIYDLKSRHLVDFLMHGYNTRYLTDDVYGVVLVYEKADGSVLVIKTDLAADPSSQDPSTVEYVTQEVLKTAGERVESILTGTMSLVAVVALAVAAYYGYKIFSGK